MSRDTGAARENVTDRKSVLHCGNCEHDSHVNGDWVLHERRGSGSVWYQCPDCGHAVSVRPMDSLEKSRFPAPLSPTTSRRAFDNSATASQSGLWGDVWQNYRDVATTWLSPWGDDYEAKAD